MLVAPLKQARSGFTLAEVAITLVIVGMTLLWVLEGLNNAKMTAAHTHNAKIAAELAMQTLGEVEAGLYWDEIDDTGLAGNYAEEGYETFVWEIVLGDEAFFDSTMDDQEGTLAFDSWKYQRELEEGRDEDSDEDEEDVEEPYEKVKIRVTFPQYTEQTAEVVLERWIPWKQVYGQDEEEEAEAEAAEDESE